MDINADLKAAYETSQKEILLLGELYRRQQEVLMGYDFRRDMIHEMEDLRLTFEDEIKSKGKLKTVTCFWFVIKCSWCRELSRFDLIKV